MSNELALLEVSKNNYPKIYCAGGLDAFYEKAKAEVEGEVPDLSTGKGRDRIRTLAAGVSRSKTAVEDPGRAYNKFLKGQPKLIDKELREFCDKMDKLRDDTRAPLTAWEVIDKAEKAQVVDTAAYLIKFAADLEEGYRDNELIDLKAKQAEADRKAEIERATITAAAEAKAKAEHEAAAKIAKAEQEKQDAINRELKAERDAEAARQLAKQSERDRIAAEQAHKEDIRIDYHKRMIQHIVDCGNGFIGGSPQPFGVLFRELESKIVINEGFEEFQQQAVTAKNEAIQKLNDCQQRQENDRVESEAKAKRDSDAAAENARQTEANRQKALQENQRRQQAQREADKSHRGNVNRAAMEAFINAGLRADQAKLAVIALANKLIPAVTISY